MEHLGTTDVHELPGRKGKKTESEENTGTKDGITAKIAAARPAATNDNGEKLLHN